MMHEILSRSSLALAVFLSLSVLLPAQSFAEDRYEIDTPNGKMSCVWKNGSYQDCVDPASLRQVLDTPNGKMSCVWKGGSYQDCRPVADSATVNADAASKAIDNAMANSASDKDVAAAQSAEAARLAAAQAKAEEEARIAAAVAKALQEAEAARKAKAEEEALLAAQAKAEEEARLAAQAKAEEEARLAAQAKAEEEARLAAQAKAEEDARLAVAQARAEEEARIANEIAKAEEEARLAEENARLAQENARLAQISDDSATRSVAYDNDNSVSSNDDYADLYNNDSSNDSDDKSPIKKTGFTFGGRLGWAGHFHEKHDSPAGLLIDFDIGYKWEYLFISLNLGGVFASAQFDNIPEASSFDSFEMFASLGTNIAILNSHWLASASLGIGVVTSNLTDEKNNDIPGYYTADFAMKLGFGITGVFDSFTLGLHLDWMPLIYEGENVDNIVGLSLRIGGLI